MTDEFIERRSKPRLPNECSTAIADGIREGLSDSVQAGVVAGIKEVAADPEFQERFWKTGYAALVGHASNGTRQWVGGRIITWLATVVFLALLGYLIRSGALK